MTALMRRRLITVVLAAGVLLALLVGFNMFKLHMIQQAMAQHADPPQVVSTLRAVRAEWQPELTSVGSLRAIRGVDLSFELAGVVRAVRFASGDHVEKGATLIELNTDSDVAQLAALSAAADLANTVYERDKLQFEAQAISQAQLDTDAADLRNRRGQRAAQAALVAKKVLRAPFAGRLGITTVNPGQYLNAGDKVVTLQATEELYADFLLPQQYLARLAIGRPVRITTDAWPDRSFSGKITAIDSKVDPATRNVQVEALVPNSEQRLAPGMFARVAVADGAPQQFVTVPQTAITYNPYGATVYLAKPKAGGGLTAQQVFVHTGATRGDQVAVLDGMQPGDLVVTSGQLKLKNGTPIMPDDKVQPRNDPAPTPQEH